MIIGTIAINKTMESTLYNKKTIVITVILTFLEEISQICNENPLFGQKIE